MTRNGLDREILKRYFGGNYSAGDESYVEALFRYPEKEKELKCYLSDHFNDFFAGNPSAGKNLDHLLRNIHDKIDIRNQKEDRRFATVLSLTLRIAAIIVFAIGVFWGIKGHKNYNTARNTYVSIQAPAWTRAQFRLPDGTTGWLNSNSGLSYNMAFREDRQVTLRGEAFFDVTKDKTPFVVSTADVSVKVLGTRFNIAAYDNEDNVEIVLEEGKIELTGNGGLSSLTMIPDQLVFFNKMRKEITTETVETKKYLSWTEGKLVFRNDPMEVVARRLERWYNVDVVLTGSLDEDFRLRATFVDESLEEVLGILQRSVGIRYRIENPDVRPDDTWAKKKIYLTVKNK